ncbi:MAG: S8 family serine peptidase [Chloroflexia bacterium]|nr:S8 family serine peptidase [Chloroflexia bacterium]
MRDSGGAVVRKIPEIGVAVVSSTDANFKSRASRASGVQSVVPNIKVSWLDPVENVAVNPAEVGNPPNSGSADFFFDLQWGHDAVDAPEAWAAGALGDGVRVAVLDDGIDSDHPDIAPNLNVGLSTSFVPNETYEYDSGIPGDPFSHGTHVSGTIAAAQNSFGTIGVAPEAELVMVKVLSSATGSGSFEGVAAGIVYAANIDADVINMSLGATLPRRGVCETDPDTGEQICITAREVTELTNMLGRATRYAFQQGTTIIASAGNDANDGNKDKDLLHLPSDSPHVLSISALGPLGWGVDPNTNLDEQAFYTNFGTSVIDFSGPGGNIDFDLLESSQGCTVSGLARPCFVFDLVFSTGSAGGFYWSAGTSMSAPHVSGVAAIIIGDNGGSMKPSQVERELRASADDLGKPGKDFLHGHGRVNAGNAVQ